MSNSVKVNKYSEIEIKALLKQIDDKSLNNNQLEIKYNYINDSKLTYKNSKDIANILGIDIKELLAIEVIDIESINFRNKKNNDLNVSINNILNFMVIANKQLEISGKIK
ncbi:hypothetical protein [Mammaliicoccus sciuri]|uniref:hypothetical protein n=1 Tax=Mammaliicoccus sciuri TaxID=1296 RepID=UPI002DBBBDC1|nr:hypothetical protein [Mammaliicoccus sciuri]MEB6231178.1 hypothetical protein [Mammaliicoccus sciuri]